MIIQKIQEQIMLKGFGRRDYPRDWRLINSLKAKEKLVETIKSRHYSLRAIYPSDSIREAVAKEQKVHN
ncbi:hypothetical protein KKD62_03715 [Patescibacteria group bacterium]|nr:hypothetical protein [Patescibacteria group bacterium]MBU1931114.1 hypothetical protein [Patescibacteria group bacterium]